jgi:arginyl-tRNA--protein-N-Asp/Glu arginylyltransferase
MVSLATCCPTASRFHVREPGAGGELGTFNILWQIQQCRRGLAHLYRGWIADSRKMAYGVSTDQAHNWTNGTCFTESRVNGNELTKRALGHRWNT